MVAKEKRASWRPKAGTSASCCLSKAVISGNVASSLLNSEESEGQQRDFDPYHV
jgi:hypothetical protein